MKRESLSKRIKALCDNEWQENAINDILPQLKNAIGGKGKIYAQVTSVARSGLSRNIDLFIVYKGRIISLNGTQLYKVFGDSRNRYNEVRINGGGMDMLFEATYRLYQFLFNQKRKPYQGSLVRYSQF